VYLLIFSCFAFSGLGQVPKIGFVNSQQVLYGTAEGKKGLGELEQFMTKQREAFEAKNAELAKLQEEYMTQQRTQDTSALASVERTIQEKEVELRRFREDAQADFNARQNEVLQGISGKIQVLIQEYAQENSFDAIFMRDQNQIYVSPSLDVTEAIIEVYNQRYPGQQAATAPAGN
jgi:Skp family chaperone for outer membrane proteins